MTLGKFIVFEGLNGSGKGVQLGKFHSYISSLSKAVPIFSTGEPNLFDENGIKAREMLSSDGDPYKNSPIALEYFTKNRKTHNEIFRPLLEKGINVLSDRYYYSNLAYQHAQGVPYDYIIGLNRNFIKPDLTFVLDTAPEESLRRLKLNDGKKGRKFDSNLDFNFKVWKNYLEIKELVEKEMNDFSVHYLNSMGLIEETFEKIKKIYHLKFD